MANRRFIDFPIAASVGNNDIVLIWQDGLNKQTTKATLLQGSPQSLAGLTDVDISALTNGQILQYNSTTSKWENVDRTDINLSELGDVTIVAPANGQVLVYNSSTSKWENSSAGYVPYTGAVTTVNLGAQTIQAGSFVKAGGTSAQFLKADGSVDSSTYGTGTVTSVALTMPTAFSVGGTPITTAGTLAVTGAGTVGQYIRGDGSLADFPATTGGGSSVSYYLNGSVSQGTIGGVAYKELNKTPIFGAGTDISISADGYIASFITDAGDPNKLLIPAGNWNLETYFSASSSGGTPSFYVELYKYNGTTFTLIATSSSAPELIAFGTNLNPYFSTLAVPETVLALTDRLALRYYVTHSGRTITLHTENNHLCQVITTFTSGLTALNGLTSQVQYLTVGTSGTDFAISSASDTHTFNLPTASATNRGALSSADWTTFNNKTSNLGTVTSVGLSSATSGVTIGSTPVTTSGTITLAIATASGSQNGLLSSTDWTTFNGKVSSQWITSGSNIYYNTGSVSIGTASVGNFSDVAFTGPFFDVAGLIQIKGTSANGIAPIQFGGDTFRKAIIYSSIGTETPHLTFGTASSGSSSSAQDQMRLFSDGNVLIQSGGTFTNSGYKLDVNGTGRFGSNTFKILSISDAGGAGWETTGGASIPPQFYLFGTGTSAIVQSYINNVAKLEVSNTGISVNGSVTSVGVNKNMILGSVVGATGYNFITLNSSLSDGLGIGLIGGATGDESLYVNAGNGGNVVLRTGTASTYNTRIIVYGATGNVNIGQPGSDSGYKLDVNGTGRFSSTITTNGNEGLIIAPSSGASYMNYKIGSSSYSLIGVAGATSDIIAGSALGDLNIRATNSQKILFSTNNGGSAAMTITSSGNVLIGTTTDIGVKLYVKGSAATNLFLESTGASVYQQFSNSSGNAYIGATSNDLVFLTTGAGTERMRISSGGSVGINNTSPMNSAWGNDTNTKQLSINGSSYAVINLEGSTGRKYSMGVGDGNFYMCYDNTAARHNITVSSGGNVLINTTTSGSSKLRIVGLPTSSAGLSSGDVYSLAGTLMIA